MTTTQAPRTAADLRSGDAFTVGDATYTVSFTSDRTRNGIAMVNVYTAQRELPFPMRADKEI